MRTYTGDITLWGHKHGAAYITIQGRTHGGTCTLKGIEDIHRRIYNYMKGTYTRKDMYTEGPRYIREEHTHEETNIRRA